MKKILTFIINLVLVVIVVLASFAVSTYALSKKIESSNKISSRIYGNVEKKETIVISAARGNVESIYHSVGEEVKRGEKLAKLKNSELENKAEVLSAFEENESAATELEVAKSEIEGLEVVSPINGYIDEISKSEGEFVNPADKLFVLFSNEDTRALFYLADYEYKKIADLDEIRIFNSRLDQYIDVVISELKPRTERDNSNQNKIGVYFKLQNPSDGENLLHGEDIVLLADEESDQTQNPIEFITDTWTIFFK